MANIDVKEVITSSDSDFNIKRFKLGGKTIDYPLKAIDVKRVTKSILDENISGLDVILLENAKAITRSSVDQLLEETIPLKVKSKMGFSSWHSNHMNLITPTFLFNPYQEYKKIDALAGYFDYYYSFSDTLLFVPNIDIKKNDYATDGRLNSVIDVIGIDEYKNFVEDAYQLLSYKNNKPIFVPLSLKWDMNTIEDIARFYLKKEYFSVWVDYQGASSVERTRAALLRRFIREYDENKRGDDLILYSTNVRREITANVKDSLSPSSDPLVPILGANILGVNRSPPVFIPENSNKPAPPPPLPGNVLRSHKARVLEPTTYYYIKVEDSILPTETKDQLMHEKNNVMYNSILLNNEMKTQAEIFLENMSIKKYISSKDMIKNYKEGALIKRLFEESRPSKKDDWF